MWIAGNVELISRMEEEWQTKEGEKVLGEAGKEGRKTGQERARNELHKIADAEYAHQPKTRSHPSGTSSTHRGFLSRASRCVSISSI